MIKLVEDSRGMGPFLEIHQMNAPVDEWGQHGSSGGG